MLSEPRSSLPLWAVGCQPRIESGSLNLSIILTAGGRAFVPGGSNFLFTLGDFPHHREYRPGGPGPNCRFNNPATYANLVAQAGIDRVAFSADYPFGSMVAARAFLDSLPLSDDEWADIGHRNAEKLLGL